jgi:hypothetical protein
VAALSDDSSEGQRLSLAIPGVLLRNGTYTVTISGVTPRGEHTVIDQYVFALHLND